MVRIIKSFTKDYVPFILTAVFGMALIGSYFGIFGVISGVLLGVFLGNYSADKILDDKGIIDEDNKEEINLKELNLSFNNAIEDLELQNNSLRDRIEDLYKEIEKIHLKILIKEKKRENLRVEEISKKFQNDDLTIEMENLARRIVDDSKIILFAGEIHPKIYVEIYSKMKNFLSDFYGSLSEYKSFMLDNWNITPNLYQSFEASLTTILYHLKNSKELPNITTEYSFGNLSLFNYQFNKREDNHYIDVTLRTMIKEISENEGNYYLFFVKHLQISHNKYALFKNCIKRLSDKINEPETILEPYLDG